MATGPTGNQRPVGGGVGGSRREAGGAGLVPAPSRIGRHLKSAPSVASSGGNQSTDSGSRRRLRAGAPSPKMTRSVRRCLFGRPDPAATDRWLEQCDAALRARLPDPEATWGFDFQRGRPLPSAEEDYDGDAPPHPSGTQWAPVSAREVPSFYLRAPRKKAAPPIRESTPIDAAMPRVYEEQLEEGDEPMADVERRIPTIMIDPPRVAAPRAAKAVKNVTVTPSKTVAKRSATGGAKAKKAPSAVPTTSKTSRQPTITNYLTTRKRAAVDKLDNNEVAEKLGRISSQSSLNSSIDSNSPPRSPFTYSDQESASGPLTRGRRRKARTTGNRA